MLLSVITINYNNFAGLKRTLASIPAIETDLWEWIVIDGGSSDRSVEYLKDYEGKLDVSVIEPDDGLYDAMNKGLSKSKGKFVWFLNSGDILYDQSTFNIILDSIKSNKVDFIYGDAQYINAENKPLGLMSKVKPQKFPEKLNKSSFRFGMSVCHQSMIVRRELCSLYSMDYRYASDIDWTLNILEKKPITLNLNCVIAGFEEGGTSTQSIRLAMRERFNIFVNHFGWINTLWYHLWIVVRRIGLKLKSK